MVQKLSLKLEGESILARVEGHSDLFLEERERIQREWEKPENQKRLEELVEIFGEYKKVVDIKTGKEYKVPTRDIITKGLNYEDLTKYPIWSDKRY